MSKYDNNSLCYVADSEVHGRGLFARTDIPAGSWIGYYEHVETDENGAHVLWVEGDESDQWSGFDGINELRFLNHSSDPNGEMDGLDLYAKRDIPKGQEITFDYGEEFASDL
jgi:SET domain-containing protein